jgi:hypothetical protein
MSQKNSHSEIAGRRAELMIELLLQDMQPKFLARQSL